MKVIETLKNHKGKLSVGAILATLIPMSNITVDPWFVEKVREAKAKVVDLILPAPIVPALLPKDGVGATIYIDGKRHRILIEKSERDRLLDMQERDEAITEKLVRYIETNSIPQYDMLLRDACILDNESVSSITRCIEEASGNLLEENYE